jgi:uncharacterized membrane protein
MALADLATETLLRYFHILAGITWIGLLYFFNLANAPLLKVNLKKPIEANMTDRMNAHITTRALFWFRWGAMGTLFFGLLLLESVRQRMGVTYGTYFLGNGMQGYAILLGIILALVMFFNVWFIIWPNQQVVVRNNVKIAAGVSDEEKTKLQNENAPLMKKAVLASRINTWFSIPMLFGMVFGAHGAFGWDGATINWGMWLWPVVALAVVLVLMALYANQKPKK